MSDEELQSKTITFLRFPMMVGVILIHSHINEVIVNGTNLIGGGNFPVYQVFAELLSEVVASISVPLFFFLSGFLFFYKTRFSLSVYLLKLKKRARTVLVPYLFWNLLVLGVFFVAQTFSPDMLSGENKLIVDYSVRDWLEAFWARPYPVDHPKFRPIAFQFWFMRDLMVVMLCSPILYVLVKFLRSFGVLILGLLWLLGFGFNLPGFSMVAFFSFSAGAYFSVHGKNFAVSFSSILQYSSVVYLIMVLLDLCTKGAPYNSHIHILGMIIGCVFAIGLAATCIGKGLWKENVSLSSSTFFLYAYHGLPLALLEKLVVIICPPTSDLGIMVLYLGSATAICIIGILIYRLLCKYLPVFLSVITGGR